MYEFTGKVKVVGELQTLAPTLLFFGRSKRGSGSGERGSGA